MKQKLILFLPLAIGVFLGLLLALANGRAVRSAPAPQPTTALPAYPQPPIREEESQQIREYELAVQDAAVDPELRQSLEEKLSISREQAMLQQAAPLAPAAAQAVKPPEPQGDPEFQSGIFEGGEGLFRAGEAVITNYWQGEQDGDYIQVFVGALGGDPDQGVVYVVITSADRMHTETRQILAPSAAGKLRVLGEDQRILRLTNESGIEFFFDIAKEGFIE